MAPARDDDTQRLFSEAKKLLEAGMAAKSCKHLEELLSRDKSDVEARCLLGIAFTKRRRYQQAILHLKTAVKQDPHSADAYLQLGAAYAGQAESELPTAQERRWDDALAQFDLAIERDRKLVAAYLKKAAIWNARGKHDVVLACLESAFEQAPDNREVNDAVRETLRQAADQSQVLARLRAVARRVKRTGVHIELATTLWRLNRPEDALDQLLAAACRLKFSEALFDPEDRTRFLLGLMIEERQPVTEALRISAKAQRALGRLSSCRSHALWATALSLVVHHEAGAAEWQRAMQENASDPDCQRLLRGTLNNIPPDQCKSLLELVKPQIEQAADPRAHLAWAATLIRLNKIDPGFESLRHGLASEPDPQVREESLQLVCNQAERLLNSRPQPAEVRLAVERLDSLVPDVMKPDFLGQWGAVSRKQVFLTRPWLGSRPPSGPTYNRAMRSTD